LHRDLARSAQCPEQHRGRFADGNSVWVLILRLNSSCNRSMAFKRGRGLRRLHRRAIVSHDVVSVGAPAPVMAR
jgi:hypothetical protein